MCYNTVKMTLFNNSHIFPPNILLGRMKDTGFEFRSQVFNFLAIYLASLIISFSISSL